MEDTVCAIGAGKFMKCKGQPRDEWIQKRNFGVECSCCSLSLEHY